MDKHVTKQHTEEMEQKLHVPLAMVITICIAVATSSWALAMTFVAGRVNDNASDITANRVANVRQDIVLERVITQTELILTNVREIRADMKELAR